MIVGKGMNVVERLGKQVRHQLIVSEIRAAAAIRVSDLAARFGVSGETIRRDLAELVTAGLINRTYGGATMRPPISERTIGERTLEFVDERSRIGAAAARRVQDGQVVMIDGGSTTYQVARHLSQLRRDLVVITNSAAVASAAGANETFNVLLCPGTYDPREGSVLGEDSVEYLERFNAHVAIVGATALSIGGPCDAIPGAAIVKRAMFRRAARAILVIDHSKFDSIALRTVCPMADLDEVITDSHPDASILEALQHGGAVLTVV